MDLVLLTVGTSEATESRKASSSSSPKSASPIPESTIEVETRIVNGTLGGKVVGDELGCAEDGLKLGLVDGSNVVGVETGLCVVGLAVVGCFVVGFEVLGETLVGDLDGSVDGRGVVGEAVVGNIVEGCAVEGRLVGSNLLGSMEGVAVDGDNVGLGVSAFSIGGEDDWNDGELVGEPVDGKLLGLALGVDVPAPRTGSTVGDNEGARVGSRLVACGREGRGAGSAVVGAGENARHCGQTS